MRHFSWSRGVFPLALLLGIASGFGQHVSQYYEKYGYLAAPASAFQDGLLGFANPAVNGILRAPETRFYWNAEAGHLQIKDWAVMASTAGLGFAMQRKALGAQRLTDYSISFGAASGPFSFGMGYDWSAGATRLYNRERQVKASAIFRPDKRVSLGLTSFYGLQSKGYEGIAELAIRPFASPVLTLFGDALMSPDRTSGDQWSAGLAWRIVPGVSAVYRRFGDGAFSAGLVLDFGFGSIGGVHSAPKSGYGSSSYMLRSGGFRNNVFQKAAKKVAYVPVKMNGIVEHQKYVLFDNRSLRFYDLLRDIRAAGDDPRIAAIVVNMTNLAVRPEHAWEIRKEFIKAREKGKQIILFFEHVGMTGYYLASAADIIVMDPQGVILLPGLVMGRTYMKAALDNMGIGFEEWRFFSHKSAYEKYSRDSLSDADREQYNAYIDDWFALLQDDICASRGFSKEKWENEIIARGLFNGKQALQNGLVDKLGRWSNYKNLLKEQQGRLLKIPRAMLWDNSVVGEDWGPSPKIALVYAIGVCDMDAGIRARYLERVFLRLKEEKSVKAVVFRVDSPGGSGMASDVVLEALKKCAEKKPVIVSQGQVAGSGGYWISIYGDKILAGPNTITGSIGVIGGWVWDKGFGQKLGLTSDHVQRGEHADLMAGVTLPLLGITIPARNLTQEEKETVEGWIRQHYDEFITKVADGRNMTKARVDSLAQGRFYSGVDGLENGLIDEIGGLMKALEIARNDAGIATEHVEIVEYPKNRGLFDLFLNLPGVKTAKEDPIIRYLEMIGKNSFAPIDMMPPGSYPSLEK